MELQKINKQVSTAQRQRLVDLAKIVYHVNQLKDYPLSDTQIADWAESINELRPEMTPEQLKEIMNKFKTGDYEWDKSKGIQNIFRPERRPIKEGMPGSFSNPLG